MRETLRAYCLRAEKEHLLDAWDAARNGELTPDTVTASSGKRVCWRCAKGHTWQTAVYARTKQNAGCPYCSNRLVWLGYNDLASQAPEIAAQWYQPLNGARTPENTTMGSHYKAWWRCPLGHIWRTEVLVRAVKGHDCPVCAGQSKIAHHLEKLPLQRTEQRQKGDADMDILNILDQIDEILYISDIKTHELLFLNRAGRERIGTPPPGVKCYAYLQHKPLPCEFCTNDLLPRCPGQRHTWVRKHPTFGNMLLHDSIVEYAGRPCRMEVAIDVNRYVSDLTAKSYRDALTGLQNRLAYEEKLLALQNGKERPIGVGFVDINGLKYLNDTLGHDYGNKALLRACDVMKTYFEPEMTYRISGDEFVILWTDVGFQSFRETCDLMAQELHGAQEELASFGRAWGTAGEELPKLIREAEQRMYDEKRRHYLRSETTASARPQYLDALLQEFRDSTFQIYLQPLYSIEQDKVYAAEGLVRKIDPLGRMHAPIEFIHMMEQERMISMVDYEMLRQACGLLVKWKAAWPEFRIGCNMSRITLAEPDYLNTVDKILAETGADPSRLTFEITEGSQGIQLESMGSLLDALRARGITLALDDMGTEAACLEMLYLPQIQNVKIDRSLICRAENSEREQIVISSLIELCHKLGMLCVAEGIETQSQVELLKKLGCDRLQGYYIGKPMPPEDFFAQFAPEKQETDGSDRTAEKRIGIEEAKL